jgi:Bacterial self-protective colicin-like immunity
MKHDVCAQYMELLDKYLARRITSAEFEENYLVLFRNEPADAGLPLSISTIIDELFYAVDAYCEDPSIRDEDDIDEHQLRESAQIAHKKLKEELGL